MENVESDTIAQKIVGFFPFKWKSPVKASTAHIYLKDCLVFNEYYIIHYTFFKLVFK